MTYPIPDIQHEGVCACSHLSEDHARGSCDRCEDSQCRFFVLRFWRDIGFIAPRRKDLADPVGQYWKEYAPRGSVAWVFVNMMPTDRLEVGSNCFQNAQFNEQGEIACFCKVSGRNLNPKGLAYCSEEYFCELFAALLLMPEVVFVQELTNCAKRTSARTITPMVVNELARLFGVEEWAVRYRVVLLESSLKPYRRILQSADELIAKAMECSTKGYLMPRREAEA